MLCATSGISVAEDNAQVAAETTIAFEFNDPNPWVKNATYSVYHDAENTVVWRTPLGEKSPFNPMQPDLSDLAGTSFWYAGQASKGRIGRTFMAKRPVLVRADSDDYKPGAQERRIGPDGAYFVVYDELKMNLERTDSRRVIAGRDTREYTMELSFLARRIDRDGEEVTRKKMAYRHRLWLAEAFPYSPAFSVPFRSLGRLFIEDRRSGLGEYILTQVHQKLRDKGLVLGVELRKKGVSKPLYRLEAQNLRLGTKPLQETLAYPVMKQSVFTKFLSMLSLNSIVKGVDSRATKESDFAVKMGQRSDDLLRGTAVFGSNARGDFALLLRVDPSVSQQEISGEKELFLLLMRPMHGSPAPGTYKAAEMPEHIETLSSEKLEKLSEYFTVMALVRDQAPGEKYPVFHALWTVESGEITIAGADGVKNNSNKPREKAASGANAARLSGHLKLKLSGIKLADRAEKVDIEIEGSFLATEGLENVGSSRITQVLQP